MRENVTGIASHDVVPTLLPELLAASSTVGASATGDGAVR